ncbi:MAG: transcriptional repressor [Raoultibacter sp.]
MKTAAMHNEQVPQVPATTRNTVQRTLVLQAVQSLHDHPTSADVYEVVRSQYPTISRATVYRNLGVLATQGEVLRVEVPNGADRYDFNHEDHYHIQCRLCGNIYDVDMPPLDNLPARIADKHGFEIESYQIIFEGVCPSCQN